MKVHYVEEVISDGGRLGTVESSDGKFRLNMAPARDHGHDRGANPELLFSAAFSSCFLSAIQEAARRCHLQLAGATLMARTLLKEDDQGRHLLALELRASLPGVNRSTAENLLHQAMEICPYARAIRGNVEIELTLD